MAPAITRRTARTSNAAKRDEPARLRRRAGPGSRARSGAGPGRDPNARVGAAPGQRARGALCALCAAARTNPRHRSPGQRAGAL